MPLGAYLNRAVTALWIILLVVPACTQQRDSWQDASAHQVRFLRVEKDVLLEVLDWGGAGPSVVLLAGSGNTAHVFDGFAEELAAGYHVYGITRRGYGASAQPESGYAAQRLGADVVQVLDSLDIAVPVLAGHSFGGQEMTALARVHPDRIRGLIYMDSTADPTFDWKPYQEFRARLPASMGPEPSATARRSFQAFRNWQMRSMGFAFPESELRNLFAVERDGSMGRYTTPPFVHAAIGAGMQKPEYSHICVPVLAFFVLPAPVDKQVQRHSPQNADEREAIEQVYSIELDFARNAIRNLTQGVPSARVVELQGAKHHLFLSNAADVLRESREFLQTLH